MRQVRNNRSSGFTLVELTLSMAFISMLLLAIALLTLQISGIFNKGLTIRAVNQAGQTLSSELQRSLNLSAPLGVTYANDATASPGDPITGGRLCVGTKVYAWNYGKALKAGTASDPNANAFNKFETVENKPIRFVKFIAGGTTNYCVAVSGNYPKIPNNASDLLTEGELDLVVHNFTINGVSGGAIGEPVKGDDSGAQRMYDVSLTVGSGDQAVLTSGDDPNCSVPSNLDDEYCAVNQFRFIARAGNITSNE